MSSAGVSNSSHPPCTDCQLSDRDVRRDPRWQAVKTRDASADGSFLYSVSTTGIYCRPSCSSRLPRPHNVAFHLTVGDAEASGFRPCKRCLPNGPNLQQRQEALVVALCRRLEQDEGPVSLEALARQAGLSPSHTHRLFKKVTGVTPRGYASRHRAERLRQSLSGSKTVTEAIYSVGYGSSSRFYEQADRVLGMTPSDYRAGGRELPIRFAIGECSLGAVLVAATSRGVCAILIGNDPEALAHDLERRFPRAELIGADADFEQTVATVVALVERPWVPHELPLDIRGTAFQQRVWQALSQIPAGQTWSYQQIARALGQPKAVRAVAGACAANALAVAIPCHRVVRTDGSLSGYRWGVDNKRRLLEREAKQ